MRWKAKTKKEQTQDQRSNVVARIDSKFKRRNLVMLVLAVLIVSGIGYGGYWLYSNGKLGRLSKDPTSEKQKTPLTQEEIKKQIEEEGQKGPFVDPNTIPHTR